MSCTFASSFQNPAKSFNLSAKPVRSALISVYHKEGLAPIIQLLHRHNVTLYSTGGTAVFIREQGAPVVEVEALTGYPSILGGRVKTLHPKVFGGILARRDDAQDTAQLAEFDIPAIDLVIVDLYPFEDTVAATDDAAAIIEKVDIGGISLIRAAAKNFRDTVVIASRDDYGRLAGALIQGYGATTLDERQWFATRAFQVSSHYDSAIFNWFNREGTVPGFIASMEHSEVLRYGENPHQQGIFHGELGNLFHQLHGKALSYNNLIDTDAAIHLIDEFTEPAVAILKHTNPCGVAVRPVLAEAWAAALAGDPVSAFGGIVVANRTVDAATARAIHEIFIEVIIAPAYDSDALDILKGKKNRIILERQPLDLPKRQYRSLLNGVLEQGKDLTSEGPGEFQYVTDTRPTPGQEQDMAFAMKVCKHLKSNAIALVKDGQLIGMGAGQTSRVDALKQSIHKAESFGFDTSGAVLASDAFFPFADSVQLAHGAGVAAIIQPGGSMRDQESIDYCNTHNIAMVMTGVRHFRH